MIPYHKGVFSLNLLLRCRGSGLYRGMIPGILSVGILLLIRLQWRQNDEEEDLRHPYAVGVLVGSVSFLIVFRANHGYNRYWEAATAVHHMMSKWMDVTTHMAIYHLQCDHYKQIKPPSFFEYPDLNAEFLTRARERSRQGSYDTYQEYADARSVSKSIEAVLQRFASVSNIRMMSSQEEEDFFDAVSFDVREDEPVRLRGKARLDGGWKELFPQVDGKPNVIFYHPEIQWNKDGQGFASTVGGRTPALFLQELAHLASLLSAVALSTLRNDIDGAESPLDIYHVGAPWPDVDPDAAPDAKVGWQEIFKHFTGCDRSSDARTAYNALPPLKVIGGVSDAENPFLQMARGPYAKTQLCWQWLSEFVIREHLAGSKGKVGPPNISRVIQFLGDGMIYYNHSRKIIFIPFPFPSAQLSIFYVIAMVFAVPLMMDQYSNELWLGAMLTFFDVPGWSARSGERTREPLSQCSERPTAGYIPSVLQ